MVVLDHSNVWLFILVLELVLTFIGVLIFLVFIFLLFIFLAFFLLFFELRLLLQFVDSFALSDFVVANDAFPHLIVVGVDELPQYFFLLFVFFLELFVEDFYFCDFGGEL